MGKSTLGNDLLVREPEPASVSQLFVTSDAGVGCTTEPASRWCSSINAFVVDTMGLGDVGGERKEVDDVTNVKVLLQYLHRTGASIVGIVLVCKTLQGPRMPAELDKILRVLCDVVDDPDGTSIFCRVLVTFPYADVSSPTGLETESKKLQTCIAKHPTYSKRAKLNTFVPTPFNEASGHYDTTALVAVINAWNMVDPYKMNWKHDVCTRCACGGDPRIVTEECKHHMAAGERLHGHLTLIHTGDLRKRHAVGAESRMTFGNVVGGLVTGLFKVATLGLMPYYTMERWPCCNEPDYHVGCMWLYSCCNKASDEAGCTRFCEDCNRQEAAPGCRSLCSNCQRITSSGFCEVSVTHKWASEQLVSDRK